MARNQKFGFNEFLKIVYEVKLSTFSYLVHKQAHLQIIKMQA